MTMPYCSKCTIGEDSAPSHAITSRQRLARVIVGLGWLTLAWFVLRVPVHAIVWPAAVIAGWFGASHLVCRLLLEKKNDRALTSAAPAMPFLARASYRVRAVWTGACSGIAGSFGM